MNNLPHSPEVERAILASALLEPALMDRYLLSVGEDDFHLVKHRLIWQALESLTRSRRTIDIRTVQSELESDGALDTVGGLAYLSALDLDLPSTDGADTYADTLRDLATRRRLIHLAHDVRRQAEDRGVRAADIAAECRATLDQLERDAGGSIGFRDMESVASDHEDIFTREPRDLVGISSTLPKLDEFTLGFESGNLWILAARPGQGKTALGLQILRHAAEHGKHCGFASLEMSEKEILQRLIASKARVPLSDLRTGHINHKPRERERALEAWQHIRNLPLYIDDSAALKTSELASRCRRIVSENGLDFLVVDYLQLMAPAHRQEARHLDVAAITMELRAIAKTMHIPVLALAQLNRQSEYRKVSRPTLADLRESGQIEQDAFGVIFLYRPNIEEPPAEIILAKNRNGSMGVVNAYFRGEYMEFTEIDRHRE